jgi:tol-pal system protein YbgF
MTQLSIEPRALALTLRRRLLAVGVAMLLAAPATAQVPVTESRGVPPGASRTQESSAPRSAPAPSVRMAQADSGGGGSMAELFYQMQLMQEEIQQLRGLAEEQAHQLDRLARLQREQYLDLDRRLLALQQGAPAPAASGGPGRIPGDFDDAPARPATAASGPSAGATETEAYARAFDLTRDRRFDDAIRAFERLLEDYPNGQYTANVHYWLGELYLALPEPELDKSRAAFERVVQVYPTNQKVPDSLYKLGVVYHRQGDVGRARQHLQRVQQEFRGTPAARLAEAYAAELR